MPPPSSTTAAAAAEWSWSEDKAFEDAIAGADTGDVGEDDLEKLMTKEEEMDWEVIAVKVGTKTATEVRVHYRVLLEDIEAIEGGKVPIPRYAGEAAAGSKEKEHGNYSQNNPNGNVGGGGGFMDRRGFDGKGCSKAEQERKKGIPWTEEEHRLFLLGLDKFGKGDWRSISRNFVMTRTPTQVASHAQKYFIRLNSMNRDRRRFSIHDITMVNGGDSSSSSQVPVTGQTNGNPAALVGPPPMKHASQGIGMYGPSVGHPVTGHMVSAAVGTPVMLSPGHPPYVMPVAYPLPPPTMHQ